MVPMALIWWIYHFLARFWPYFNFVDFGAYFGHFSLVIHGIHVTSFELGHFLLWWPCSTRPINHCIHLQLTNFVSKPPKCRSASSCFPTKSWAFVFHLSPGAHQIDHLYHLILALHLPGDVVLHLPLPWNFFIICHLRPQVSSSWINGQHKQNTAQLL